MRKYFSWRCIGLHVLVLVLVSAFLLAGWWQYQVALGGNELSWVYTVEWPLFALYAIYIWWKLIHDESTPFDRLWAAKQRATADAEGKPLYEIPGWATDAALSREVLQASRAAAAALAGPRVEALASPVQEPAGLMPADFDRTEGRNAPTTPPEAEPGIDVDGDRRVIDAQVLEEKGNVDEELDAYNRYLFELSRNDPPKRWSARRNDASDEESGVGAIPEPEPGPAREVSALPPTGEDG